MCNPLFKFRVLTEWADKLNCAWVATGHYSRLEEKDVYKRQLEGHNIVHALGEDGALAHLTAQLVGIDEIGRAHV